MQRYIGFTQNNFCGFLLANLLDFQNWTKLPLDTNRGYIVNNYYHIVWEDLKKKHKERPFVQIPLPVEPLPQKKPLNDQKDKEKRGVYIFEM
jgi:hypothetical protein